MSNTTTWICFNRGNGNGDEYIREDFFTNQVVCKCGNGYGGKYGCYDAECYSADNSSSDFFKNMFEDLKLDLTAYNEENDDELEANSFYRDGIDALCDIFPKRKEEILAWEEEHTMHTEEDVYEYWDGHNYKTLFLKDVREGYSGYYVELEILDKNTPASGVVDHELLVKDENGDEFWLTITRYANDVTYSREEKDEEN